VPLLTAVTGDRTAKTYAVASDGEFWVSRTLKTITTLEADSKYVSILVEVDKEDQKLRRKTHMLVQKLRKVSFSFSVKIQPLKRFRCLRINEKMVVELSFS